ncbi:MAG: arylsulfotransferase family protein [Myxococcota bacterium]
MLTIIALGGCAPPPSSEPVESPEPDEVRQRCPVPDPAAAPIVDGGPPPESPARGLWWYLEDGAANDAVSAELMALANLGYVAGLEVPKLVDGVLVNEADARDGLAFYTSGHGAVAVLMDLEGEERHRWGMPFEALWPERIVDDRRSDHQYWRRAALRPNGDVLAIIEGQGLIRLDWNSEVVWSWGGGAHHDLEVLPDERVWVLSRQARMRWDVNHRPLLEDFVTRLDAEGCPEVQISLLDAVLASSAGEAFLAGYPDGDVFHTNSLRVLDDAMADAHPAFQPGHLLLSMRTPSGLVVLDPDTAEVVWWWQGPFREQHDPEITRDGHLMVFDNIGLGENQSAVRAFGLEDGEEAWRIDQIDGTPLRSRYLGAVQELDAGHLLITESNQGHAFELNARREVVWSFRNPERAGPRRNFVAVIPEMLRIPHDYLTRALD